MSIQDYEAVIGLEIHVQLITESKIFSSDPVGHTAPNENISVVSLAHPGTLPVLNERVLDLALRMGLACRCEISRTVTFDRKNYFYPDLPKGYQITQHRFPICRDGFISIFQDGKERDIPLEKIHMEEDAGKSIHEGSTEETGIDFNRAGTPLLEIVTEPEIHSADEAAAVVTEVRKLVRYLDISDGNMEAGSLRCDANVSVRPKGATTLGQKVEIKNLNSVRNLHHAIRFEIERQVAVLNAGDKVVSETRMFDAGKGATSAMRTKEELNDYRYFPDPDLSTVTISDQRLDKARQAMPALPQELRRRFVEEYHLSESDAVVLTESKALAMYFMSVASETSHYKAAANWVIGPVKSYLNETGLRADQFPVPHRTMAALTGLVAEGRLSFSVAAQRLFPLLVSSSERPVEALAEELGLFQDRNEEAILPLVLEVIREFPLKVEEYKKGKKGIVGMFMGEVMRRSKVQLDPGVTNALILKKLSEK